MKHSCRNCHFLAKTNRSENGEVHVLAWNTADRNSGKVKKHYSASCFLGVWDSGIEPSISERLNELLDENRKGFCFFMKAHPGMSFEAAKVLQERSVENLHLKRTNLYTQIGLWIAAIALVANLILALIKWLKNT